MRSSHGLCTVCTLLTGNGLAWPIFVPSLSEIFSSVLVDKRPVRLISNLGSLPDRITKDRPDVFISGSFVQCFIVDFDEHYPVREAHIFVLVRYDLPNRLDGCTSPFLLLVFPRC